MNLESTNGSLHEVSCDLRDPRDRRGTKYIHAMGTAATSAK